MPFGLRPGGENTFVRSSLSRWGSDKHLFAPRFRVGERKYKCSFLVFASWRTKYICSVSAFALGNENTNVRSSLSRLGDENTFVRSSLSRWGSNKHLFVARFRAGERKYICSLPDFVSGRRKYICSVAAFALGKRQTFVRCPTLRLDDQQISVCSSFSRWGSATRTGFCQNHTGTAKTFPGAARFRVWTARAFRI